MLKSCNKISQIDNETIKKSGPGLRHGHTTELSHSEEACASHQFLDMLSDVIQRLLNGRYGLFTLVSKFRSGRVIIRQSSVSDSKQCSLILCSSDIVSVFYSLTDL
ncbi:uncharacterized protein BDCG_07528 [Blastomyces dermatitidis ER-3]|uniref:Uncharacterized protein n=1 Tax=Ajellomyces dermatitidis (strain ER-3 / ATCC MYA-2586) TaxID=559297 RepID=A0ABP2F6T9_AJEDR|nr:uncharacterized protein BDCG_07528 [Blastomyces dermatitidis ER-3]EEQ92408.2 hypothetical protein BDCG_07528 [Blastomyces dermatitidis ER-3]